MAQLKAASSAPLLAPGKEPHGSSPARARVPGQKHLSAGVMQSWPSRAKLCWSQEPCSAIAAGGKRRAKQLCVLGQVTVTPCEQGSSESKARPRGACRSDCGQNRSVATKGALGVPASGENLPQKGSKEPQGAEEQGGLTAIPAASSGVAKVHAVHSLTLSQRFGCRGELAELSSSLQKFSLEDARS